MRVCHGKSGLDPRRCGRVLPASIVIRVGRAIAGGVSRCGFGEDPVLGAAEQIGATVQLFDPVAYAGSLLCVIAARACAALVPVLRAGRVNPLAALRPD